MLEGLTKIFADEWKEKQMNTDNPTRFSQIENVLKSWQFGGERETFSPSHMAEIILALLPAQDDKPLLRKLKAYVLSGENRWIRLHALYRIVGMIDRLLNEPSEPAPVPMAMPEVLRELRDELSRKLVSSVHLCDVIDAIDSAAAKCASVPVGREELREQIADRLYQDCGRVLSRDESLREADRILALLPAQDDDKALLRSLRTWANAQSSVDASHDAGLRVAEFTHGCVAMQNHVIREIDRLLSEPGHASATPIADAMSKPSEPEPENCASNRSADEWRQLTYAAIFDLVWLMQNAERPEEVRGGWDRVNAFLDEACGEFRRKEV